MISSFIESSASFSISASKKELLVVVSPGKAIVVSLKTGALKALELLIIPVNKKSKSSNFSRIWFNLSGIFVSNVICNLRCQN